MSRLYEKIVVYFLVRRWLRLIKEDPDSPVVIDMAAKTGNLRGLKNYKDTRINSKQEDEHIHQSDGSTVNPSKLICRKCGETYTYDTNLANSIRINSKKKGK